MQQENIGEHLKLLFYQCEGECNMINIASPYIVCMACSIPNIHSCFSIYTCSFSELGEGSFLRPQSLHGLTNLQNTNNNEIITGKYYRRSVWDGHKSLIYHSQL